MKRSLKLSFTLFVILGSGNVLTAGQVQGQAAISVSSATQIQPAPLRLPDLERIALEKNPTLSQAAAKLAVVQGWARQAGLYPNPFVAMTNEDVDLRTTQPVIRGGEQGFYVEQEIPLGHRLGLSRRVLEQDAKRAEADANAQIQKVLNSVRILFYRGLAAQRKLEFRESLVALYDTAVGTTKQLTNVGQADAPDLLEIEIEQLDAQHSAFEAGNELAEVWIQLASVVGDPGMQRAPLTGSLDGLPDIELEGAITALMRDSPELVAAQAGVARSEAAIDRARASRIPDLRIKAGAHRNRIVTRGWESTLEIGFELPLFDRNQGEIAAANAELRIAEAEVDRVKLALRARLAPLYGDYLNMRDLAVKYRDGMLPRAVKAFELYDAGFRQMAAAYPQVLIARRTLLQLQERQNDALLAAWERAISIQGLLLDGGLDAPRTELTEFRSND